MDNIKEINLEGERIFLKKNDYLGWGVVHPYRIDGKINWKNLLAGGNYLRLTIVIFIVLVCIGFFYEHAKTLEIANECLNNTKPLLLR